MFLSNIRKNVNPNNAEIMLQNQRQLPVVLYSAATILAQRTFFIIDGKHANIRKSHSMRSYHKHCFLQPRADKCEYFHGQSFLCRFSSKIVTDKVEVKEYKTTLNI